MKPHPMPPWMQRAREMAAKAKCPAGAPFAAKKSDTVAKLYLYDVIGLDPWTDTGIAPADVVSALDEAKGASSLEVYVNSPGGYVFDGIAIYNAIRSFDGPKTVYVDGIAASIASIIALAGDKVVTNEGAMWMVHDPAAGVFSMGTADQIEEDARKVVNGLRKARENLLDIYVSATGRSLGEVSAWMTAETWMTAAEATERGFSDEVGHAPETAPEAPPAARKASAAASSASESPRTVADRARNQARSLSERFAAASRSDHPGQPGSQQHTSTRSTR